MQVKLVNINIFLDTLFYFSNFMIIYNRFPIRLFFVFYENISTLQIATFFKPGNFKIDLRSQLILDFIKLVA